MQNMKNKKVWLFILLGIVVVTSLSLMVTGKTEKKAYANGRFVERQDGCKDITFSW